MQATHIIIYLNLHTRKNRKTGSLLHKIGSKHKKKKEEKHN